VELDKLKVLHWDTCACYRCIAITSAGVRRGTGEVCTTIATSCDDCGVGSEAVDGSIFHAYGSAANALTIISHDQIHSKVLHEEQAIVLQRHSIEGVQNGVARAVCSSSATVRLTALAKLEGLTAKGPLIDPAIFTTGERQAKGLELKHNFWSQPAHVLDGILITKPV
jgi:hypothetical protein